MNKKLQLIIDKSYSDKYTILMRGHMPNPKFDHTLKSDIKSYEKAYRLTMFIKNVLLLTCNEVEALNSLYAYVEGDNFCEHMAFEKLPLFEE